MATPLAIAAGIGSAARKGILIRDAEASSALLAPRRRLR